MPELSEVRPGSGTKVILEDPHGRLLCLLRDDNPAIVYPITWDYAGGGQESGETLLECGVREVEEEIGIRLNLTMLDIIPSKYQEGVLFGRAYGRLTSRQISNIVFSEGKECGLFLPAQIATLDFVPQLRDYTLALYGIANRVKLLERTA